MISGPFEKFRVYIKPGHTDMRKSFNGLTGIIQNEFGLKPYSKSLFVFCNRKTNLLKIIYWDRNGFCIWQKRLEQDRFPWPEDEKSVIEISQKELNWILNGIDFRKAHQTLDYSIAG